MTSNKTHGLWVLGSLLLLLIMASPAQAEGWEVLLKEEGITVTSLEVEGRSLPVLRGKAVIKSNIFNVLAVLSDTSRNAEWMHNCAEATLLKQVNKTERIIYNRTKAPWPVSDRDVVTYSKARIDLKNKTVLIKFYAITSPLKKEVDGVVRMPHLKGSYKLKMLGEDRTHITYQIDADPGGFLPDWLTERTSREIPLHTLRNLRKQVKKTRGQYVARIKAWEKEYREDDSTSTPETVTKP